MKVKSSALREAIARVSPICGRRSTLPILSCLKIEARGGILEISATDLDCFAVSKCECDGELEPVCVSARMLAGLVANAPEEVTLSIKDKRLLLTGNGTASLSFFDASEIPAFPVEKATKIGLNCEDLANCIEGVAWAASDDPMDYLKAAIWITTTEKSMRCVATDLKTSADISLPSICAKSDFMMIAAQSDLICEALRGGNAVVSISDNHLFAHSESMTVCCKQVEGKYFNIDGAMKKTRAEVCELDNKELLAALQSVQMVCKDKSFSPCTLTAKGGSLEVSFKDSDSSFSGSVKCDNVHDSEEIRVNATLLAMALKNSPDGKIKMTTILPSNLFLECAGQITGVGLLSKD